MAMVSTLNVRIASLEDAAGIVDVHRSGVERWLKREDGRVREARYEELSIRERYLHGGPWMSIESCAVHLNNLLLNGHLPVVAEIDGRIVGEAELLISEEPVNGRIERIAHLDVIEVHREFRGRGIGRVIVEFLEELASDMGCTLLTTNPDPDAVGFYQKIGVSEVLYRGYLVKFETSSFPTPEEPELFEFSWDDIKNMEMAAGRFQTSYHQWFVSFVDRIAGVDDKPPFESGRLGKSYYVLKGLSGKEHESILFMWGRRDDIPLALGRAKKLGFRKVLTVVDRTNSFKLKPGVIGENLILGKRL
ncbi:GNAT family N-acetyltransferase [Thermococcus sp. GR6]|uniref:GNAT family N-acetyltransferase n=1 Tax=Thermococcus sp. GR6 TaxID=1638256 RepID=UPI001F109230|nr:GNAT family N-acetyltransferase [Thermococcus sp. GR6]